MTTYTLWSQAAQTVDGTGAGNAGTVGTHFTVSAAATLDGVWLYSPAGHGLTQLPATVALYNFTTTALVTSNAASWSGAAGSGWVFAAFTSPPAVVSGTQYLAAAFRNDAINGWFALDSAYSWPASNGILTAPKDTGNGQGWFSTGTALAFPASQLAGYSWYLDPQVTAVTAGALPAAAQVAAAARQLAPPPGIPHASVTTAARAPAPPVPLPHSAAVAAARPLVPLAQGYPDAGLGAMVELNVNGTWTDVTAAALPDGTGGYGQVKSGQPDGAQQPNPSGMNGAWDNPDHSLTPRNSDGPYYPYLRQNTPARVSLTSPWGTYLRLEGGTGSYAWCPDTSRLDITGSLDVQVELRLSGSRLSRLAYKDNGAGSFCWELTLQTDGTLALFWFDSGGTQRQGQSDVAFAVSVRAVRATLDASSGTVTFYTASSIAGPWTQAGSAVSGTSGAATTVRTGSGPLSVGSNSGDSSHQTYGQVTAFRLYNGISAGDQVLDTTGGPVLDTTGGPLTAPGAQLAADAAFSSQAAGITAWNDVPGNRWQLAGDAELSGRNYLLYGELSTANPTAHTSGGRPRLTAAVSGRLRRLQQAAAAPVDSPLYRAILAQQGSLFPAAYWPMEDGSASRGFGPAVGGTLLSVGAGKVKPAADTTFEASAALPQLNGAVLTGSVPFYSGGTAWAFRFPLKLGSTVPAGAEIARVNVTGGACDEVKLLAAAPSGLQLVGSLSGSTVFDTGVISDTDITAGVWASIEATVSGGSVTYATVTLVPGATIGQSLSHTVTGTFGTVTGIAFNIGGLLTDTVIGHAAVQKAWVSMGDASIWQPLNAWRNELAADRFYRICTELGIPCRILGRPSVTQAMGPQPRGSEWTILKDCANTEQGIIFEPSDVFGVCLRTREALGTQAPALTLDFAAANLPGDLQPADDDQGFYNDITASMPDGTAYRVALDDGSPTSVSEPPVGRGRYASQPPFQFNLASSSQLPDAATLYLKIHSADEARYRNVTADFGIPGLPVAGAARLRRGDLIVITNVPAAYQTVDIQALAWGATETFGPGRKITWDTVPASPYQ